MNSKELWLATGMLAALAVFPGVDSVRGQERARSNGDSPSPIEYGFKRPSLPLLRRGALKDVGSVSAALVEKLCPAPCRHPAADTPGNMIEVATESWSLQVLGDGSAVRFRDVEVSKRAHRLAKSYSDRASAAALESEGRKFIEARLASVIILGPGEELVPVRTEYRIEGGHNLKTHETVRSVTASHIVFGRTIRGTPVVGGGSTIVLTFANDGSVESFQYDWPKYEEAMSTPRDVVGGQEILRRVEKVISMRVGIPSGNLTERKSRGEGAATAIELSKNMTLQKLECGYYDPGYVARVPEAAVQAGCVYHAVSRGEHGIRAGFAGAVPGAVQIEADAGWPEAGALRRVGSGLEQIVPQSSRPD
ncbi:MAG TPA: hypothetical protein VOA88_15950 [Candidatus Dormibacteraeota bacterium]|nr:hypothetical protein [Candidatus Dormibacteraeota bacterium]